MIKMGSAKWVGSQHSQELRKSFLLFSVWCVLIGTLIPAVLIVLVTDMVVILVERDQKYGLASLQDRKVMYWVGIKWSLICDVILASSHSTI